MTEKEQLAEALSAIKPDPLLIDELMKKVNEEMKEQIKEAKIQQKKVVKNSDRKQIENIIVECFLNNSNYPPSPEKAKELIGLMSSYRSVNLKLHVKNGKLNLDFLYYKNIPIMDTGK